MGVGVVVHGVYTRLCILQIDFFQLVLVNEKKNEFCKVRQESIRNERLFFVSTTRDIQ
jgi:hypothetical protein